MIGDIFLRRWRAGLVRDADHAPTLSPLFVLQQGGDVLLADVRAAGDARGVMGHIPGSVFLAADRVPRERPVVLVDGDGREAARLARRLEQEGHPLVAALAGGLAAWRHLGLLTSRGPVRNAAPARTLTGPPTADTVRAHVGDPLAVRWIQLASLARLSHLSCVDGRDERGVIGTPGGDAGEFVLELAALEALTGTALDDDAVAAALLARLDSFGELYLHTDLPALTRLLEAARAEGRLSIALAAVEDLDDFVRFLRSPGEDREEALLALLVDPAHIGCGHLRLMLQHGEEYGVRQRLAIAVQREAWKLLWRGSPEILVTALSGGHKESAVLNVRVDEPLWGLAYVPLIFPRIAGEQVFVNHPDAVSFLREAHLQFLVREPSPVGLEPSRADEFRSVMEELGARQLSATLRYLADGLPIYDVTFYRDGRVEVREP